ncbi:hypothetical protein IAU60_000319 [Kwoniella sp. DSM 27419]
MDLSLRIPPHLIGAVSPSTAQALSLLFTSSYVGSLYLSQVALKRVAKGAPSAETSTVPHASTQVPPTIPPIIASDETIDDVFPEHQPPIGSRDHPATIKSRVKAVSLSTLLSITGVYLTVKHVTPGQLRQTSLRTALTLLGLRLPANFTWTPYLLAPVLMAGPMLAMWMDGELPVVGERRHDESLWDRLKRSWREAGLIELRNYVVGPITEELVFRSSILSVSILGGLSIKSLTFGTPLWFGIAHAHHAYDTFKKNGGDTAAAIQAVLGSLFQLSYTTLFGWFASYLYLKTGSVVPPIVSHIFCNIMGLYLPTTAVARHPRRKAVIWSTYLAGIACFVAGIRRL